MRVAQTGQERGGGTGAKSPVSLLPSAAAMRQMARDLSLRPARPVRSDPQSELDRLRSALGAVAELVTQNPVYAPIFLRLEEEIAIEEARQQNDVLARARAIARQKAMGPSSERTKSSEPPWP